jgi:hypothetical protein
VEHKEIFMMKHVFSLALIFFSLSALAQEPKAALPADQATKAESAQVRGSQPNVDNKLLEKTPVITEEKLPPNSRLYVAPMSNGFDTYVIAGLEKKKVPIIITTDRSKAEYELSGVSETDKAGWAKMLFLGSQQTNETASIKVVNLKTGSVVFAYSANKTNSARGKQSAGEAVAKHINEKVENRYH